MQPRKSPASSRIGPFATLALIAFAAIVLGSGIWILTRQGGQNQNSPPLAAAPPQAVSTETSSPTEEIEPTSDAPAFGATPEFPTPEPTYAVRPTAQFAEMIPIEEWETFDNPDGFSVKYPPDWIFETFPGENGSTTSLLSYDPHDPNLPSHREPGVTPSNYTKVDIALDRPESMGFPLEPNEKIEHWLNRAQKMPDTQTFEESTVQVDGVEAFRRVTGQGDTPTETITYLQMGPYIMFIAHPYDEEGSFNSQVIQAIIDSIEINN